MARYLDLSRCPDAIGVFADSIRQALGAVTAGLTPPWMNESKGWS